MQILVFTSPNCPHCPGAEHVVQKTAPHYSEFGVSHKKVRVKTSEGKELFDRYNVMGTPTILFVSDEGAELNRIVGTPNEENLKRRIEKVIGIKKSFFNKIFSK